MGAHRQTGTRIHGTIETGTEMDATATAVAARVMFPVGKGLLSPHVLQTPTSLVPVIPIMGGITDPMMMPVPETTAEKTGIVTGTGTGTETEIGTGTGTGIEDTTADEAIPGHRRMTMAQTVHPRVEELMVPETVIGAVGTTTEEKEKGIESGRGVGTVTTSGPGIANMTDDRPLRPIDLRHYPRAEVSPLSLVWVRLFTTC